MKSHVYVLKYFDIKLDSGRINNAAISRGIFHGCHTLKNRKDNKQNFPYLNTCRTEIKVNSQSHTHTKDNLFFGINSP